MTQHTTPMMKQYGELKKQHPNAILFFRIGDFYEMFHDDAVLASKILEITLTTRDKGKENAAPLCGVPYHAASGYIQKLIKAGHSVAVCEQTEEATTAKGVVQREVVRVITPGTLIEPELLSPNENNYVAALHWDIKRPLQEAKEIGMAFLDISTGTFCSFQTQDMDAVESALFKIDPKEMILPNGLKERSRAVSNEGGSPDRLVGLGLPAGTPIRFVPSRYFVEEEAYALLRRHFQVHSVSALGQEGSGLIAAGALLAHLNETQKGVIGTLTALTPYPFGAFAKIHPLAQQHLNLVPKGRDQKEGTLLHILDKTVTAMGARRLRHGLLHPLRSPEPIANRQSGVAFFHARLSLRHHVRDILRKMADVERLIGRIRLNAAHPRDLIALKNSVMLLPEIFKAVAATIPSNTTSFLRPNEEGSGIPPFVEALFSGWDNLDEVAERIDRAILPDPPLSLKEGGVIREGYIAELDEIRHFQREGRSILTKIEIGERQKTGIDSLKVRYNQVFGYYIEVSETHLKKIPPEYIRKQTLTRAERFITPELKTIEERLVGAEEKRIALERMAFNDLLKTLGEYTHRIQAMAQKIATIDLIAALAEVAHQNRYVQPEVNDGLRIRIVEGRHPVLEKTLPAFVPNDTMIDPKSARLLLLTGPNMAGKSTYMQQVALIVLMAQIGGFVPAREATIGVVDQFFTRVGAQDALTSGMSTFMVEMTEMAQILRHATEKSLILLDELGRGTSTFDGISIAWAVAEHLHRTSVRTLFATHYHELTQLSRAHEGIRSYHAQVREWNDEIIFLRKVVEGSADKSYGIEVGRLAGLPTEIIKRAKTLLQQLETADLQSPLFEAAGFTNGPVPQASLQGEMTEPVRAGDLFSSAPSVTPDPILEKLQSIDPNAITPMQALALLAELSEQAKKERT